MKKQSIVLILFLLLTLLVCAGCQSVSPDSVSDTGSTSAKFSEEEVPEKELAEEITEERSVAPAAADESSKDVVGVFEGLEDNHTAVFSFNGAETAFYFDDSSVQNVLSEAITGSPYTLSYRFDSDLGLNVIYEISE